jgi:hypothetical protein
MAGEFQSPPTTSGIVVISGSEGFDLLGSDFPVAQVRFSNPLPTEEQVGTFSAADGIAIRDLALEISATAAFTQLLPAEVEFQVRSFDLQDDIGLQISPPTTSGIQIIEFYPGAGAAELPFVPPIVGNVRIFPVYEHTIPEENVRIYPRLPQFSTLTPGD